MFKGLWDKLTGKSKQTEFDLVDRVEKQSEIEHSLDEMKAEQEYDFEQKESNIGEFSEMLEDALGEDENISDSLNEDSSEEIEEYEWPEFDDSDDEIEEAEEIYESVEEEIEEFEATDADEEQDSDDDIEAEAEDDEYEDEEEPVEDYELQEEPVEDYELEDESDLEIVEEPEEKVGFFKRLFSGLDKTRKVIADRIDNLIHNYGKIDDELFDELEEILITSDISMSTTMALIDSLREELVARKITDSSKVKLVLRDVIVKYLNTEEEAVINTKSPSIILVIGVNGAGKTTTIGKISHKYKTDGHKVLLAAADTFRAAAIDQLKVWATRAGVDVIAHAEGSDPSAVIYDAISAAKARKTDILIIDSAGRLHNKVNLMNELNKMFRVIEREYPEASREVLLVLDATTGQNALSQAKLFKETADITGLILTKLDGTSKGGFVLSVKHDLGLPVKLIGVGEGINDLQKFSPVDFANALLDLE